MCVYALAYVSAGALRGQKEGIISDPLDLELQAVMSCPAWVLETGPESSASLVCALDC